MDELDTNVIYTKKVPVYQNNQIVKYIAGNMSCLVYNNKAITEYYSGIKYLKTDDYYKVAYNILENKKIVTRYKVIKLQRDENNRIIPFKEQIVINDLYRYIYYAGENTLTIEKDGFYSYIDLDSESPYYLKPLFPFTFVRVSSFGLEYPYFARVNIELNSGYIYHVKAPINKLKIKDLFTEEEVEYLVGLFNDAEKTAPEKLSHYAPKLSLHL